jgi:hypothetical protein
MTNGLISSSPWQLNIKKFGGGFHIFQLKSMAVKSSGQAVDGYKLYGGGNFGGLSALD